MVSLCPSYSQTVKAMTFNIRLDTPVDEENMWDYRKVELLKLIDFYSPDFLGLQEVLHNQLVYINSGLNNYSYIGVGREDGNEKGEYSPIFYNSLRFELINHHTF
ncbi:MAG: endonuclease/exonuclease/phosphatase, partial [Bacteroidetes bacterium HGW-Bacteroidetes-15]